MNNFLLKTQINDNPPQLWRLNEPFDVNSKTELTENLNYLMQSHFLGFESEEELQRVECIDNPMGVLYFIGEKVLLAGDVVNQCFTRESAKADCVKNFIRLPLDWQGTSEEFKNFILAMPDDEFNDFLAPYRLSVPAFDKPTGYRDTLKILRTTAEDVEHAKNLANIFQLDPYVQCLDAFDFLKVHLINHVSELDNSGFSVATLKDDAIVFTAGAMVVIYPKEVHGGGPEQLNTEHPTKPHQNEGKFYVNTYTP